jgi:O-antigen/teichoic acid export membrane protein
VGVVQRQSIKQSLISWTAMVLGAVNLFFVYPYFLSNNQIGILQFVVRTATFFIPFALLGTHIVAIRYYNAFSETPTKRSGFLFGLLGIGGVCSIVVSALIWIFQKQLSAYFNDEAGYFSAYLGLIVPLLLLMSFSYLIVIYTANLQRIVIPSFYWNLLSKITIPLLIIGFGLGYWGFSSLFTGLVGTYIIIAIGLVLYLLRLQRIVWPPDLSNFDRKKSPKFWVYFSFVSLFGISYTILTQVDALFVGALMPLDQVAVYSLAFFLAEAMDAPRKAILSISGPLVVKYIEENDYTSLQKLYQQVSIHQVIAAGWLFLGTLACVDPLFDLMPRGDSFRAAFWAIVILGLGRLIDAFGSLGYEIINYSKYYRRLIPLTIIPAIIAIGLDIMLIPRLGLIGAAWASVGSLGLYIALKCLYIGRKFSIWPITAGFWRWLGLFVGLVILIYFLPMIGRPVMDFLWRGLLVSILYALGVYLLRLSSESRSLLEKMGRKVLGR